MTSSLKLQTRVAMIPFVLMISALVVQAQSGRLSAGGVVADHMATRQAKFVVIPGARVEIEQNVRDSPRKFTTSTDKRGVLVSAPNYRGYELKFFVDSDSSVDITVLLSKSSN